MRFEVGDRVWGIEGHLIEKLPELVASDGDRVLFAANPALVRIGVRRKARWVAKGDDLGEWWVATVEPMHVPFRNPATRYIAGGSTAAEAVQRALGFARECKLAGVKIGYYHHPQKP